VVEVEEQHGGEEAGWAVADWRTEKKPPFGSKRGGCPALSFVFSPPSVSSLHIALAQHHTIAEPRRLFCQRATEGEEEEEEEGGRMVEIKYFC
jgi:hypothetical protein